MALCCCLRTILGLIREVVLRQNPRAHRFQQQVCPVPTENDDNSLQDVDLKFGVTCSEDNSCLSWVIHIPTENDDASRELKYPVQCSGE
ncbi:hypothetical protein ACROYT_G028040 [Oculina patagonica]